VDRCLVVGVVVDTFDDIYFAVDGPVGAVCPESWPSRTTSRHVYGVHDEQAAIILALSRDANALAGACNLGRRFYGHDRVAFAVDLGKIVGLRCALVDELNSTVCGVTSSKEVPTVKEVAPLMSFGQLPTRRRTRGSTANRTCCGPRCRRARRASGGRTIATKRNLGPAAILGLLADTINRSFLRAGVAGLLAPCEQHASESYTQVIGETCAMFHGDVVKPLGDRVRVWGGVNGKSGWHRLGAKRNKKKGGEVHIGVDAHRWDVKIVEMDVRVVKVEWSIIPGLNRGV